MSYFSLPNSIINKVERWEQRKMYGDTGAYNQMPLRNRNFSISHGVLVAFSVLYIGAPIFVGLLLIHWLPLSQNWELLLIFLFILSLVVASVIGVIRLAKRGH